MPPLLAIEHLSVSYRTRDGDIPAVVDFSLALQQGECVGLVGESGCGKSTVALAVMQYLGPNGRIVQGQMRWQGRDLRQCSRKELQRMRGAAMAMVYQEPTAALNPSLTIGTQLVEVPRYHFRLGKRQARERARQMLADMQLADVDRMLASYPHQLSGGQLQRVVIAMALLAQPALLLDEPTTALDVTVEAGIVELIGALRQKLGTSILYISHNLGLIATMCDRVCVMYAGQVVETGPVAQVYQAMRHPYTRGLFNALPLPHSDKNSRPLRAMPGQPPVPQQRPAGCVFGPRCDLFQPAHCLIPTLPLQPVNDGDCTHLVRCVRWQDVAWVDTPAVHAPLSQRPPGGELLSVDALRKMYVVRQASPMTRLLGQTGRLVYANASVTLQVREREIVALVGESGSGKSTVARVVTGLETASGGRVIFQGVDLAYQAVDKRTPAQRRAVQMVFQHPHDTLNPGLSIGTQMARAVQKSQGRLGAKGLQDRVRELLERVQLSTAVITQYPCIFTV